MPEPVEVVPVAYQLRVVLAGISPLIWRRLVVWADSSIADLHAVLQVAFGWSGEHLHRFVIHGAEYGIAYSGGLGFADDAHRVRLSRLGFRIGERFTYEYDFTAGWRHDLRVEAIIDAEPGKAYPRCTGGRRAGPPETCCGPAAFLAARQHWAFQAPARVAEILCELMEEPDSLLSEHPDQLEDLRELRPWLALERFDRRGLNKALAALRLTEGSQT
jgi:hypothetical protein